MLLEEISTADTGVVPTTSQSTNSTSSNATNPNHPQIQTPILHPSEPEASLQATKEQSSKPCKTFTCFKSLPTELRLKIWIFTYSESRTIRVHQHKFKKIFWAPSPPPQPLALKICSESRTEVLKSYKPMFGSSISRTIWFAPEKDVFAFPNYADSKMILMRRHMSHEHISAVKRLRLSLETIEGWMMVYSGPRTLSSVLFYLLAFVSVEEIVVVVPFVDDGKADLTSEVDLAVLPREGLEHVHHGEFKDLIIGAFKRQRTGVKAFEGVGDVVTVRFEYGMVEDEDEVFSAH